MSLYYGTDPTTFKIISVIIYICIKRVFIWILQNVIKINDLISDN